MKEQTGGYAGLPCELRGGDGFGKKFEYPCAVPLNLLPRGSGVVKVIKQWQVITNLQQLALFHEVELG